MRREVLWIAPLGGLIAAVASAAAPDGSVLPFPPAPSASVAGPTLQTSKHQRRVEKSHLPKDAPNILIIMLDDVGFGLPDTSSSGGADEPRRAQSRCTRWPAEIRPTSR